MWHNGTLWHLCDTKSLPIHWTFKWRPKAHVRAPTWFSEGWRKRHVPTLNAGLPHRDSNPGHIIWRPDLVKHFLIQFAQPIRLLLEYTGTEYEDRHLSCGSALDPRQNSCWTSIKNNLGFDFPNLPFYIDGKSFAKYSLTLGLDSTTD
jgi:hypothetical protein